VIGGNVDFIQSFLTGELDAKSFIMEIASNEELNERIRTLVLTEDANNRGSHLWKSISYDALKSHGFDCLRFLKSTCKFDNTVSDNLNLHDVLRRVYGYYHPEVECTQKYEDTFDVYLDAIQDCFDGPEVDSVVERIIQEALLSSSAKTKQRATAKTMVKEAFHILDRKRPRWIQGPEWPMGKDSPMQFVEQKCKGEEVHYLFCDVKTGETRTVVQWF